MNHLLVLTCLLLRFSATHQRQLINSVEEHGSHSIEENARKRRQTDNPEIRPAQPQDQRQAQQQRQSQQQIFSTNNDIAVDPTCNFGAGIDVRLCGWENINPSMEKWEESMGENQFQLGGPANDNSNSDRQGGYALYESSRVVPRRITGVLPAESAMLISPLLPKTRSIGLCMDFWYAMDGLSQDRLRIRLRTPVPLLELESKSLRNISDEIILNGMKISDGRDDIVLWEQKDSTDGKWENGQIVYTFNEKHALIFEGLPIRAENPNRAYRGFIAVDSITFPEATNCRPFCNFEGGFCSWTQDSNDDFDWSLSRGSTNTLTGPPMDRFSFNYGTRGGGYAFIDSSFPRRPQDKARLLSETFTPPGPDAPLCLRFWTHMYGRGIGALRVIIAPQTQEEEVIWEVSSEQDNNWYQAQVTLTSDSPFQIIFEGQVGDSSLGDIAIDEISMKNNACPTSPQTASSFQGDCTFEVDECGWRNVDNREQLDEADFIRTPSAINEVPFNDHTLKIQGSGHYMSLRQPTISRGGRSWLMSPLMESVTSPMCMSFWYFMRDSFIGNSGASLGALQILRVERSLTGISSVIPIWEMKNQQGSNWMLGQTNIDTGINFFLAVEGVWGNSQGSESIAIDDITFFKGKCTTKPLKATKTVIDCDFSRGSCLYTNSTSNLGVQWIPASGARRPSGLNDHTYNVPVGYMYYDVFSTNTNQSPPQAVFMSSVQRVTPEGTPMCLTFWYAAIGQGVGTRLEVNRESADVNENFPNSQAGAPQVIWAIAADQIPTDVVGWQFGQVQISTTTDYKISFVGQASKGGFALDDIKVVPGECTTKPIESIG